MREDPSLVPSGGPPFEKPIAPFSVKKTVAKHGFGACSDNTCESRYGGASNRVSPSGRLFGGW